MTAQQLYKKHPRAPWVPLEKCREGGGRAAAGCLALVVYVPLLLPKHHDPVYSAEVIPPAADCELEELCLRGHLVNLGLHAAPTIPKLCKGRGRHVLGGGGGHRP